MSAATNELTACIESLIKEQRVLCHEVANSTLSATRLRQRLIVARRYFTALSRHRPQDNKEVTSTALKIATKSQKMYALIELLAIRTNLNTVHDDLLACLYSQS